jgi:hypothetical protein
MEYILENWSELLLAVLAVAKIVANLTPTTADDVVVFGWLDAAINAIVGNNKKRPTNDEIERRG